MAQDPLDELYTQSPDGFTATRTELAKRAKQRGDTQAAKEITAARRPTKAAWVVNLLVIRDPSVRKQLGTLGERLRAAHQKMDGKRIRELSAEQRHLIDALVDKAFRLAEIKQPAASVREDVVGTLQAAVADPEVADALGRLAKPESWSGFADGVEPADDKKGPEPAKSTVREEREQDDRRRERAKAESLVHAAERERDDAQRKLDDAEQVLAEAKRRLERLDDRRSP